MVEKHRRAPPEDSDLRWLFWESEAALGLRSGFGAVADMALSGIVTRGLATGDGKITERLVGGLGPPMARREGVAGRQSRLLGYLERCGRRHAFVLWRAYGPWTLHPQTRQALGPWACVVPLTASALRAYREAMAKRPAPPAEEPHVHREGGPGDVEVLRCWLKDPPPRSPPGIGPWLANGAKKAVLTAARTEAADLVAEAYAAWCEARGRRRRQPARMVADPAELDAGLVPEWLLSLAPTTRSR